MTGAKAPAPDAPPRRAPRARRSPATPAASGGPPLPAEASPARVASPASILPKALSAMDATVSQADAAAQSADIGAAERAARVSERLLKVTNGLRREDSPRKAAGAKPEPDENAEDEESLDATGEAALLERLDSAIALERDTRVLEVEQLLARGLDPRSGWFWEAEAGEWFWRPGQALADDAQARGRRRSGEDEDDA